MSTDQQRAPREVRGPAKAISVLWVVLFVLWLIVNSSVEPSIAITGALISLVLAWIFARRSDMWQRIDLTPRAAWHFLAYTLTFFIELVKANIAMLGYVYSPRIDIRPGVVKVHMRLKSPIGRLALANSIALTPGSLVMDVRGDEMFIHWLDVKTTDPDEASALIVGPYEKHLEAIFG
jgi:multicomponent Na+:H+ antiporter subunit E